jgi:lipopolysaccharide export system protein LptA
MRRLRWLLPPAIVAIAAGTGWIYVQRRDAIASAAPSRPQPLEDGVRGRALDWCYTQSEGARPRVDICAARLHETGGVKQLEGARIKLYHGDASKYDLVQSDLVRFDEQERKLYSEGEVNITLAVPVESAGGARLLAIHSSGVEFSADTGKVFTDRAVSFEFAQGGGSAVGAYYDPAARELRLNAGVVLDWHGKDPDTEPLHIEAGETWYFERESKVLFNSPARLARSGLTLDADSAEVILEDGAIRLADLRNGRGVQKGASRAVEFGAEQLFLHFNERMAVERINAEHQARLVSTSGAARTAVTSNRLDLTFRAAGKDSALDTAVASGNSAVETAPVPRRGVEPADTRVLRSDVIRMFLRPGGEEIDRVVTDGAGTIEFAPNRPGQPRRSLAGDRIWIEYGEQNRIRRFRAVNASTRTERPGEEPVTTSAREVVAAFDPRSDQLDRLEHNADFRYREGANTARSERAVLEQTSGVITLAGSASATDGKGAMSADTIVMNRQTGVVTLEGRGRASDASGSVAADRIVSNRKTGDLTAEGHVTTTRLPDGKDQPTAMLSDSEVIHATAQRMTSSEDNTRLRYEGDAKAWQGANRIEAARIEIDRKQRTLEAHGNVVTQLADRAPAATQAGRRAAVFTVIHAPDLFYAEATREARYSGGVHMERPNVTVDARELTAYLTGGPEDATLDKALGLGEVKISSTIVDAKGKRTRTGTAERGEYYTAEQKIHLSGGRPTVVDSVTGSTTGGAFTWWAGEDRLLGEGAPQSVIHRK